jgi:hypothetical protein
MKRFGDRVDDVSKKAGKMGKSFGASAFDLKKLAGIMAGGFALNFAKNTLSALDAQKKFADTIGATTKNVVGLNYAADLNGSSMESMQTMLTKFSVSLGKAVKNGDTKKFEDLGVSIKDAAGNVKTSDQVMIELADTFAKMENGTAKTALAVELFGKKGAELIPTLNQGTEALKAQIAEGANLKGANDATVVSMEEFNDALTRIESAGMGIVTFFVNTLSPVMDRFSTGISQWAKDISERMEMVNRIREMEEQGAKAELRRASISMAYFNMKKKMGYTISAQEEENYNKLGDKIARDRAELGLTEDQMRLENKKAELAAIAWAEREKFGKFDAEAGQERAKSLQKEIDLLERKIEASKPKKGVIAEDEDTEKKVKEKIKTNEELQKEAVDRFGSWIEEEEQKSENARIAREETRAQRMKEAGFVQAKSEEEYAKQAEEDDRKELDRFRMVQDVKIQEKEDEAILKDEEQKLELERHNERIRLAEEEKNARINAMQTVGSFASRLNSAIDKYNNAQINKIKSKFDIEKSRLEENAQTQVTLASGNQARIDQINEELAEKKTALAEQQQAEELAVKRKTFDIEQSLAMVEATMNGAVAITQALASAPPPLNFALAAGVGIATAAEIALIKSQKLAAGGSPVGKNAIVMMNEQGPGTERILNASGTKTAGNEFVSSLNSGKSMQEALNSSGFGKSGGGQVINVNVAGFVDSPRTVEYIANAVSKAVRKRR